MNTVSPRRCYWRGCFGQDHLDGIGLCCSFVLDQRLHVELHRDSGVCVSEGVLDDFHLCPTGLEQGAYVCRNVCQPIVLVTPSSVDAGRTR